jgi:anti-anti-sigma factor
MSITTKKDGFSYIIKIKGRFDFAIQNDFRKAYENEASSKRFILDLSETEYMDSSALGMLLLLRDYAGTDTAKIELINCRQEIKNILEISNFQQLFTIS